MCLLGKLQDQFEGTLPEKTRSAMVAEDLEWLNAFSHPDMKQQLAKMTDRNVEDGRSVLVVNCWFSGKQESKRMWQDYASLDEGIAIRSTLERLDRSILVKQKFTTIGKVQYVNFSDHEMDSYAGNQACERALLKEASYSHEMEVRIITHNVVCPGTLNPDGTAPTSRQLSGPGMFNPDRPGLYLLVNINTLIEAVVYSPSSTPEFRDKVLRMCKEHGLSCPVEHSALSIKKVTAFGDMLST
jgi:hypothetical protein